MTARLVTQEVTKSPTRLPAGLPIPLLLMPLETDLRLLRGVRSATFTRSTIKTFDDKDNGLVKTAAIDVAAFERNGILIEGASTNLLLRSEEFDNASWIKTNVSISANAIISPDGTLTSDKITDDATNSFHSAGQTVTVTVGGTYTSTRYVKRGDIPFLQFRSGSGAIHFINIRTSDMAVVSTGTGGAGTIISSSITPLTNGWFRVSMTGIGDNGAGTTTSQLLLTETEGNIVYIGTGKFIHEWGAQLEELPFPSSYIKTVASTVTKTDEDTDIDAANIPAPTADYTISMEIDAIGFDSSLSQVLFNVAGETSRRIAWNTTTGAIEATHGAVTSVSTSTFVAGDKVQISFAVDATNQTLFINGIQEDQDAKGTVTGTATAVNIGHQAGVNQAFSHIKDCRIDKVALIASQAGAL